MGRMIAKKETLRRQGPPDPTRVHAPPPGALTWDIRKWPPAPMILDERGQPVPAVDAEPEVEVEHRTDTTPDRRDELGVEFRDSGRRGRGRR